MQLFREAIAVAYALEGEEGHLQYKWMSSIYPLPLATSSSIVSRQHLPLISVTTNMHNQCYTTAHIKNESAPENKIIQPYKRYICLLFYCKIA